MIRNMQSSSSFSWVFKRRFRPSLKGRVLIKTKKRTFFVGEIMNFELWDWNVKLLLTHILILSISFSYYLIIKARPIYTLYNTYFQRKVWVNMCGKILFIWRLHRITFVCYLYFFLILDTKMFYSGDWMHCFI